MDDDVYELLRLLTSEGFGLLAAETLGMLVLGNPVTAMVAGAETHVLATGAPPPQEFLEETGAYEPVAPTQQLAFAVAYLKERLVEPALQLAEAERIAGELSDQQPIMIDFQDHPGPEFSAKISQKPVIRDPGDSSYADRLAKSLDSLLS